VKRLGALQLAAGAAAAGVTGRLRASAATGDPFKIGVVYSYSGAGPAAGPEMDAAIASFQKVHGDTVAGRKVSFVRRDDTGVNPEVARRAAQELIVQEKVDMLMGLIFTANSMAVGDISNASKTPVMLVLSGATGLLPKFPYMTRWSFTTLEICDIAGKYAAKAGHKSAYVIFDEAQIGFDANTGFTRAFEAGGGKVAGSSAAPLVPGDYTPYLLRARDAKPDVLFIFKNVTSGVQLLKQADALGLQKSGTTILSTGDLVSENNLPQLGDAALGIVSAFHYSAAHDSALNRRYQREMLAITKGNPNPSFGGVSVWDILTATYRALQAQAGNWDADKTMAFLQNYKAESPRGPIQIDRATRDIVQNIYLRRVEKRNGAVVNTEFETFPAVYSPEK